MEGASSGNEGAPADSQMNGESIITILMREHEQANSLFAQYPLTQDIPARRKIATELLGMLHVHDYIEHQILYPAVQHLNNGGPLALKGIREHEEVRTIIRKMTTELDIMGESFDLDMSRLASNVLAHSQDEELLVFPAIAAQYGPAALVEMGQKLEVMRRNAPPLVFVHPPAAADKIESFILPQSVVNPADDPPHQFAGYSAPPQEHQ